MCTYIHTCTCMYTHIHIYTCMCMHVHIYMHARTYMHVYVCIHVCVYICIYICVYVMSGLLVGQRLWKEEEKGRNLLSSAAHALVSPPLSSLQKEPSEQEVWRAEKAHGGHTLGSAPPDSSWSHPGSWGSSALGQQLFLPGH